MKWFSLGLLISLFIALSFNAFADDPHNNVPRETKPHADYQDFTAAVIAIAQIHPELGTKGWQLGGGLGFANDDQAIAIGGHKRVNKTLWGGTIAIQNNEVIGGFGFNLKFP